MRHGSLFSGIGGFDLAAEWMGWENVFQVEKDEWCRNVLAKNFPDVQKYDDIKTFDGKQYNGAVELISGGFPCQPFSVAGKRNGKDDDRYLWEEMFRVVAEIEPAFVVGENVTGIIGMALDTVLFDLEAQGYTTETFVIPACAKNAWHKRERVWVVAYKNTDRIRCGSEVWEKKSDTWQLWELGSGGNEWLHTQQVFTNTNSQRGCSRSTWEQDASDAWQSSSGEKYWEWNIEPGVGRVANGIPKRVDRLRGLGNAVVPQIPYAIFKAIEQFKNL